MGSFGGFPEREITFVLTNAMQSTRVTSNSSRLKGLEGRESRDRSSADNQRVLLWRSMPNRPRRESRERVTTLWRFNYGKLADRTLAAGGSDVIGY